MVTGSRKATGEDGKMTTIERGFSGGVAVVAILMCWAGTGQAQPFPGGLPACRAEVQACRAAAEKFPATGQTFSFHAGDDGAVQAGATLSYTDNGDGTITDNNTNSYGRSRATTDRSTTRTTYTRGSTPSTCTWRRSTRRTSLASTTGACRT